MAISVQVIKILIACFFVLTSTSVAVAAEENFNATFGSSPSPWKIDVRPGFIEETLRKVSLTRYTKDIDEPDFTEGPPKHNVTTVRDYWVNHYDWFDVQARLNER